MSCREFAFGCRLELLHSLHVRRDTTAGRGLDFQPARDGEILRSIKTLETINGKPVAEFWERYDKGEFTK
jgi:hypothetical protein